MTILSLCFKFYDSMTNFDFLTEIWTASDTLTLAPIALKEVDYIS